MVQVILVGIAAGVAAALLFLAPMSGSGIAFPLFILTGLPIAIAGLGWGTVAGLLALVTGAATVGVVLPGVFAVVIYLCIFAAPTLWLARLAGMSRPVDVNDPGQGVEWYPLGSLLWHGTLAVGIGVLISGFVTGYDRAAIANEASTLLLEFMSAATTAGQPAPTEQDVRAFADLYVAILPFSLGMFLTAALVFNLWLGGIIARASGRLARPRQRLWTVIAPNDVLIAFGVALVLAFVLPDPLADGAKAFAGAFGCGLAMIGLAVLHALTQGISGRGGLLAVAYALVIISGLPLILFAVLGAIENFVQLRARRLGAVPPA